MVNVVAEGRLAVPLFHGTSTYFWPSIKEKGLGGANIVDELRILPLLEVAWRVLVQQAPDLLDDDADHLSYYVPRMIEQAADGANWRHGSVYVTLSPARAVSYASAQYGSELLTTAAKVLDLLRLRQPETVHEITGNYPRAWSALQKEHRPVLLEIADVEVGRLRSETGAAADGSLLDACNRMTMGFDPNPQISLELLGVTPVSGLVAYSVSDIQWGPALPDAWTCKQLGA